MTDLNSSCRVLYKQALTDPSKLTEEDILNLLVQYPYSQPLVFAYERRKSLLNEVSSNKAMALLYASNSNWLWNYVNKPVAIVEEIIPEQEGYIPFEEWDNSIAEEDIHETIAIVSPVEETAIEDSIVEENIEKDVLDKLVFEGSIIGDYFIFDEQENKSDLIPDLPAEFEENKEEIASDKEDVSLYNDDLMPYSFRWWLHKTRLEHADTYQPYATPSLPKQNVSKINFKKIDENILDQQIKENIINFQDPEMKLSEEVKKKSVEPALPKKSDEIIERFIKEEPIIQAPSAQNLNNENMARQSAEDNYVLVTETLANIYIDQSLYLKAIEVFKKLILKYPEKKSYFATRIQELEKNI